MNFKDVLQTLSLHWEKAIRTYSTTSPKMFQNKQLSERKHMQAAEFLNVLAAIRLQVDKQETISAPTPMLAMYRTNSAFSNSSAPAPTPPYYLMSAASPLQTITSYYANVSTAVDSEIEKVKSLIKEYHGKPGTYDILLGIVKKNIDRASKINDKMQQSANINKNEIYGSKLMFFTCIYLSVLDFDRQLAAANLLKDYSLGSGFGSVNPSVIDKVEEDLYKIVSRLDDFHIPNDLVWNMDSNGLEILYWVSLNSLYLCNKVKESLHDITGMSKEFNESIQSLFSEMKRDFIDNYLETTVNEEKDEKDDCYDSMIKDKFFELEREQSKAIVNKLVLELYGGRADALARATADTISYSGSTPRNNEL